MDGGAGYFLRQGGQNGWRGVPANMCRSTAPTTATNRMISVVPNARGMFMASPWAVFPRGVERGESHPR
jgi:hypothetical protein